MTRNKHNRTDRLDTVQEGRPTCDACGSVLNRTDNGAWVCTQPPCDRFEEPQGED